MGEHRTAWHYFLGLLLAERCPRCFEVRAEEPVTRSLQHMDWRLLRRRAWSDPVDPGETLVALWPMLPPVTILEYKSATKGYRDKDVHRLIGYGHQYFGTGESGLTSESELALVLMVASRNAALDRDIARLRLRQRPVSAGYTRLEGLVFPLIVADLAALTARDRDDYVALFAASGRASAAARSWWYARYGSVKENAMDPTKLEDIEVMERRFLDSLPIERRLEGLTEAEAVLALPDAVLAGLSDDYVASLPDDVRARVLARRARR